MHEFLRSVGVGILYLCEVNKTLSAMEKFSHNITEQTIVNWYNQAKQGDAEAQYYAGMYESLYNDFRSDMVYYWHKAAEQGLAKAQFRLGAVSVCRLQSSLPVVPVDGRGWCCRSTICPRPVL